MVCNQAQPVGYVPYSHDLDRPADRRRFPRYAAIRSLPFNTVSGWQDSQTIVLSTAADITRWVRAPSSCRIVVDLPDAFLDECPGWKRTVRGLAKWTGGELRRPVLDYHQSVERLLERADAVVCSTDEQVARIARHCPNVHPILDLHGEIECLQPSIRASDGLDIMWEGLTATLPAVRSVLPAFRAMAGRVDVRLHLVTDVVAPRYMNRFFERRTEDVISDWGVDVRLHQWSLDTLTEVAGSCDIAIVPVDMTDPMAVGKPENRMRVFWRLGLPVVASASPSNVRAASLAGVEDRVVCSTGEEWKQALESLRTHPEDRLRIARAGQDTALNTYSEESLAQRWDRLFESL